MLKVTQLVGDRDGNRAPTAPNGVAEVDDQSPASPLSKEARPGLAPWGPQSSPRGLGFSWPRQIPEPS